MPRTEPAMSDHDASEFTFAYRADTGERVYIPRSHLEVFKGSFRLSQRQKDAESTPASTATDKKEK